MKIFQPLLLIALLFGFQFSLSSESSAQSWLNDHKLGTFERQSDGLRETLLSKEMLDVLNPIQHLQNSNNPLGIYTILEREFYLQVTGNFGMHNVNWSRYFSNHKDPHFMENLRFAIGDLFKSGDIDLLEIVSTHPTEFLNLALQYSLFGTGEFLPAFFGEHSNRILALKFVFNILQALYRNDLEHQLSSFFMKNFLGPIMFLSSNFEYFAMRDDKTISSFSKRKEVASIYGNYLQTSNRESSRGVYILIQGDDGLGANIALTQFSFLSSILVKKGYDVINIDAKVGHKLDMAKVYEIFQEHTPDAKIEGIIIAAHGGDEGLEHLFSFSNNHFSESTELNLVHTTNTLKEFSLHFRSHFSENLEFALLSCKSGVLKVDQIINLIPELKCILIGAKEVGQNMVGLHFSEHGDYIKRSLLSSEKFCPVVDMYHEIYDEHVKMNPKFEHQYMKRAN